MCPTRKEQDMNVVQQLIEQTVRSVLYSHHPKFKVRSNVDAIARVIRSYANIASIRICVNH